MNIHYESADSFRCVVAQRQQCYTSTTTTTALHLCRYTTTAVLHIILCGLLSLFLVTLWIVNSDTMNS